MKVLSIFGTRPEAIKMAPVVMELRKTPGIDSVVCVTGQHREMLDQVLDVFSIEPDFDLNLMTKNQTLSQLTARLFVGLEEVIQKVEPRWVLAQGDTTTVMVAAIQSYHQKASFGHVEAGLRTGDLYSPWPEEGNRLIADRVAECLWPPTERARQNLLDEGIDDKRIHVTGNTVIDALKFVAGTSPDWSNSTLARFAKLEKIVLVTAHRRESFGGPFREMCGALRQLADDFAGSGVHFVYPVHLNPNVQKPVQEMLGGLDNLHLIDPLGYVDLVHLMRRSLLILTDSGGIQEEAPGLGVPVLVMREKTERPEGVEAGVCRMVGTSKPSIAEQATRLLEDNEARNAMAQSKNPYGDGKASQRIVSDLLSRD